jgi:hypothetical protein
MKDVPNIDHRFGNLSIRCGGVPWQRRVAA